MKLFFRIFLVLLLSLQSVVYARDDIPEIGSVSLISLNKEKEIGRTWWRNNYRRHNSVSDFVFQSYAEDLVGRLAQGKEMRDYDLHVRLLSSMSLNAFAVPGGIIGLNLGLWRHAETEGELASIVAHELAHLSQRHFARMLEDARKNSAVSLSSILVGLGLIIGGNAPAGALAIYGSVGYQQDRYLALSRRFETEADNLASTYMRRAGYSAEDVASMFHRMEQLSRFGEGNFPEYLRTHPLTSDRLNNARLRANQDRSFAGAPATDYDFVRRRALFLGGVSPESIASYKSAAAQDYARALSLHTQRKDSQAARLMLNISHANPRSSFLFFSAMDSLLRAGEAKRVLGLLERRARYGDQTASLHYFFARSYAMLGDYRAAVASLQKVLASHEENEHIWSLLSEYYGKLDNKHHYFRADAVKQVLTGSPSRAKRSFTLAKEHAEGDEVLLIGLEDIRRKFGIPRG